jgi:uncharacterized protein
MSERRIDAKALDVPAFARSGGELDGECLLSSMPRLSEGLWQTDAHQSVRWNAAGSQVPVVGGEPEVWLHLTASGTVDLQCQRCLGGVRQLLEVDRRFRFVRDEAVAARLDEDSEDDVMVLPVRLDLMELLEDELILALPIVPMHDECPKPLHSARSPEPEEEKKPNPFAALAALRTRKAP